MKWEPVIGLEIHVQLSTRTKMFCSCELSFGEPPNTRTCPVCLGLPGTLPVANAQAVLFGLQIGLALGCELAERSIFHRKNYFYPDLPKGYQISQYDIPLCRGGRLGDVRIHRVHLEEDAAKLVHVGTSGRIHGSDASVVDFNRGGTPLVEIVTEPDLHSPEQAREWLNLLRATLRQLGVSDVNMEEGSLRADANVSLRPAGNATLGTKTELKNMNSFRFLERGLHAEIARQADTLDSGEEVVQETLHFDPGSGALTPLRSKEEAHDYRYFPEPDLTPIVLTEDMLQRARAEITERTGEVIVPAPAGAAVADAPIPNLPEPRAARYEALGVSGDVARQLAYRPALGNYFERVVVAGGGLDVQQAANWVAAELAKRLGEQDPMQSRVSPQALAALVRMAASREVSAGAARQVLDRLVEDGGDPAQIVDAEGLGSMGDGDALAGVVAQAIEANPDAVDSLRAGRGAAIGQIVGHVMRETKGRADGGEVSRLIREHLGV